MHKRSAVLLLALFAIGCGAEKETAKSGSDPAKSGAKSTDPGSDPVAADVTKVTFLTPGMA